MPPSVTPPASEDEQAAFQSAEDAPATPSPPGPGEALDAPLPPEPTHEAGLPADAEPAYEPEPVEAIAEATAPGEEPAPPEAPEPADEPELAAAPPNETSEPTLHDAGEPHAQEGEGFPIPGLTPAEQDAQAREPLPPASSALRARPAAPMRRGFRRGGTGGLAAGSGPRRRRPASISRLAAVVALLAVAVAVVLLAHSLTSSSHGKALVGPPVVKVLIPEGKTRVQIAQIAAAAGLKGEYRRAARRSPLLNPVHYGAPHGTPDLEGFLFPATYDMDRGGPVSRLVEDQLTAFQENFGLEEITRARALGRHALPAADSRLDGRARGAGARRQGEDRGGHLQPAEAGMPLGIDATIYYAVEMQKGIATYTHELTEAQLHIDSPYNTRTHTGLPPTPISNPGAASIQAAAHPAHVPYLYYVAAADGCGEHVFSTPTRSSRPTSRPTRRRKARNGGHPPKCKHG